MKPQPLPDANSYFKYGLFLHQKGQLDLAKAAYHKALSLDPKHFDALHHVGLLAYQQNQPALALSIIDKALQIRSSHSAAHSNKANALLALQRLEEAVQAYDQAITLNPAHAESYNNRGAALKGLKLWDAALASYDRAIALNPDYADAYANRGKSFQALKQFEAALDNYDRAISLKPHHADTHYMRGSALHALKRPIEALDSYAMALKLDPHFSKAQWNQALTFLTMGQFDPGWALYEHGWLGHHRGHRRNFNQPLWLGKESLHHKTILLHSEQGLGDSIQFCRYVKAVKNLGAKVILEVPKVLMALFQKLSGVDVWVAKGAELPDFDYHCPLMSLPLAFKTELNTIPADIPYLSAESDRVSKWSQYLGTQGFKIAICWQGNPAGHVDEGRSFPVKLFNDISKLAGVRLISLQKNHGAEQLSELADDVLIERLPDDFDGKDAAFLDSAAVMQCVDLVITCDTALTHLAGALGAKTWLALKYVPDWRWMLDRADSPWYRHHRLFRQSSLNDWQGVFNSMRDEIVQITAERQKQYHE